MSATFFPSEVRRALANVETWLDDNQSADVADLVEELRRWERKWRAGEARLVVQVENKPNGEGGL